MKFEIYIIGLILLALNACDMVDNKLHVINESNNHIILSFDKDSIIGKDVFYNISIIEKEQAISDTIVYCAAEIKPKESKKLELPGIGNVWKRFVKNCDNKTLNLFVFNRDTILKYDCEIVIDSKMYELKQIPLEELIKAKWTVSFD